MRFIKRIYNGLNISARRLINPLYPGIRRLPFLHLDAKKIFEKNYKVDAVFTFLQVGAFDGVSHDWLFDFVKARKSKGIVVEPVPSAFEKLKYNYAYNPQVVPVQAVVHQQASEAIIYTADITRDTQVPDWVDGISSLDKQHLLKEGVKEESITPVRCKALPIMRLVSEYGLPRVVDLVQIDTEGYDAEIIRGIDFSILQPKMIRFEYTNLDTADLADATTFLRSHGYYCTYFESDILAVKLNSIWL